MAIPDETTREEMVQELFIRLDHYMTTALIDRLPAEDMETFIQLNEQGKSKEEIEAFIREKIPNAEEVFASAMSDFRDMYLGNVTVARNAPDEDTT